MRRLLLPLLLLAACDADRGPAREADAGPGDADADARLDDAAPDDAAPADAAEVDAAPSADAAEPDAAPPDGPGPCGASDPEAAVALFPDVEVTGQICRDRAAFYALAVPAGFDASVTLSFRHQTGDLELSVYDAADRALLGESATAADVERVAVAPAAADRVLLIELYGFRGATGPYRLLGRALDPADAAPIGAEGRVTAIDRPLGPDGFTGEERVVPAAGVEVELVRVADGAAVARGLTDADGRYALAGVAQPGAHRVRARAAAQVAGLAVEIRDAETGSIYAVESADLPAAGGAGVDLHAAGSGVGAAFHIANVARRAFLAINDHVPDATARLAYRWQPGVPWDCGSCYSRDVIRLGGGFADPDEFDDAIILHELGHWFVDHFSADSSPGGTHRDLQVSPALAYGEGVAYFFAAMIDESPLIIDTFIDSIRAVDLEAVTVNGDTLPELAGTTTGRPDGALREEIVGGILWDAHDADDAAEPFDTLALGTAGMFSLLVDVIGAGELVDVGPRGVDLADILNLLGCTEGADAAQALADDRGFPWEVDEQARCEKGTVPPPFRLVSRAGRVWLEPDGPLPALRLRRAPKDPPAPLHCLGPCALGPADPDALYLVSAQDQPWAGAMWAGPSRLARAAGGRVHQGLRLYPSAASR